MRIGSKHINVGLMVASAVIAIGLVMVVVGLSRGDTSQSKLLPEGIESIDPVRSAVGVPNQTHVFVDLVPGMRGVLIIDGIEPEVIDLGDVVIPEGGEQIALPPATIYEAGNATLTYQPSKGAPIEKFEQGQHTVTVLYWKFNESRERASSFTWTFQVF